MPPRIADTQTVYEGWTRLVLLTIDTPAGERIRREVEDHGRAAAVLPYDPVRRMTMLVRLLRAPVLLAGGEADCLEAPAGLVEETDGPDTARREAMEETGLRLGDLEPVASVWSMPGISTERLDLFLAPYSAGDRVAEGGGLVGEQENITVVEMPLAELWTMATRGTLADMKTLTLVLALHARRPELFVAG